LTNARSGTMRGVLTVFACILFFAAALCICSCSGETAPEREGGDQTGQEVVQEEEAPQASESTHPTVDWFDYRYTFLETWRDRDLNPQSEVIDYGGDYVHLRVEITRISDENSGSKTPLQVLLNCKGREYRIFGKDYTKQSYLWRDYTDFPDGVGESHVYVVTMELVPYSRALNSSFSMEEAELVLNGMDWTNVEQPRVSPLARFPLTQLNGGNAAVLLLRENEGHAAKTPCDRSRGRDKMPICYN
jgi:hypothetical protein